MLAYKDKQYKENGVQPYENGKTLIRIKWLILKMTGVEPLKEFF